MSPGYCSCRKLLMARRRTTAEGPMPRGTPDKRGGGFGQPWGSAVLEEQNPMRSQTRTQLPHPLSLSAGSPLLTAQLRPPPPAPLLPALLSPALLSPAPWSAHGRGGAMKPPSVQASVQASARNAAAAESPRRSSAGAPPQQHEDGGRWLPPRAANLQQRPLSLEFASKEVEAAYQAHQTAEAARWDVPVAAASLCVTAFALAWTWRSTDLDRCLAVAAAGVVLSALFLAVLLALRPQGPRRNLAVLLSKLLHTAVVVALGSRCKRTERGRTRTFVQALLWESGGLPALLLVVTKPLPLREQLASQAVSWATIATAAVGPLCAKYGAGGEYYGPLLQRTFLLIAPMGLAVHLDPGDERVPTPACCCRPVVLLVSFLVGFLLPMCGCHARDYFARRRFAAAAAARLGGRAPLQWPWALELSLVVAAHNVAWLLAVGLTAALSDDCQLPEL